MYFRLFVGTSSNNNSHSNDNNDNVITVACHISTVMDLNETEWRGNLEFVPEAHAEPACAHNVSFNR